MKLITKEIEKAFLSHPIYSTDGRKEKKILAKFFTPWGNWTWYVTEAEKREDGDWLFFGYVVGLDNEWGYFTLSQLKSIRGPFGLTVERDMYLHKKIIDLDGNLK